MQVRAAVADGAGGFGIDAIEVGDPGPGEVVVRIGASGVCHTDLDMSRLPIPGLVMGHEGAGTVEAVGDSVRKVKAGDRVLLTWSIGCGACRQCSRGNEVLCEGKGLSQRGHAHADATTRAGVPLYRAFNLGTLSERTVVQQEAVVPLPEDVPFPSACILGCGVMTGWGSVVNAAKVEAGSSVVVLGTGGVGLNVVQAARIAGAAQVIAVDLNAERLAMATRFGATHELQADAADGGLTKAADEVKALTGGGADYAFECTAVPALAASPLAMVRNGGTAIAVSGVEEEITVDMRLFEWDKTYLNPLYGKCRPSLDFPRLFALYRKGDLLLDELVTRTYTLDDLPTAFEDMLAGRNAKGVVTFAE